MHSGASSSKPKLFGMLVGDSQLLQQRFPAWIVVKILHLCIVAQPNQSRIVFLIGPFQPLKRFVFLVPAGVDVGDTVSGRRFELPQCL